MFLSWFAYFTGAVTEIYGVLSVVEKHSVFLAHLLFPLAPLIMQLA